MRTNVTENAIDFVMANEGGFVDKPSDRGGATNYGISLRFLQSLSPEMLRRYGIFEPVSVQTIKDLTSEQARLIYRCEFWEQTRVSEIENRYIATYVFDMMVLHGQVPAICILQRACWAVTYMHGHPVDDGILGDKTLAIVNMPVVKTYPAALMAERAGYCRLIAHIQDNDKEFLHGWLERCYRFPRG